MGKKKKKTPLAQQQPDFFSALGVMIGNASLSGCIVAFGSFWAGVSMHGGRDGMGGETTK